MQELYGRMHSLAGCPTLAAEQATILTCGRVSRRQRRAVPHVGVALIPSVPRALT